MFCIKDVFLYYCIKILYITRSMDAYVRKAKKRFKKLIDESQMFFELDEKEINLLKISYQKQFADLDFQIQTKSFSSVQNEIKFYKKVLVKWIKHYCLLVKYIEMTYYKPVILEESIGFYKKAISTCHQVKCDNMDLHGYYVCELTTRDEIYYVNHDPSTYASLDPTNPSYIIANFEVNEVIIPYINATIFKFKNFNDLNTTLKWTGSNTDLALLINGLVELKLINKGNCTKSEVVSAFDVMFNMKIQKQLSSLVYNFKNRKEVKDTLFDRLQLTVKVNDF
ncbi:RteC protein [Myroides phaeus]|uniref:RteC protein n=2 Tax=Myroides phaeus TaxID=702745 RepID=A0A1G8CKC5_9FLAO|nr:RteC protein [Myroides phaeus]